MNSEYLKKLICVENSTLNIIRVDSQTLNECFLNTYLQIPAYLVFAITLAFSLGSSTQMPRIIKRPALTILRLKASVLLLIVTADIFINYFTNIYPQWQPGDPEFCTHLVLQLYQLVTFGLNVFVLFNRNVFRRVFPVGLIASLFVLVFVNLVFYVNRVYAAQKTFDQMVLFEKIEVLKLTFFNALLAGYLLTVLMGFKFESLRVLDIHLPSEAIFNQKPEEDEASYFSYLSFR